MSKIVKYFILVGLFSYNAFTQEVRTDYLYGLITDIKNAMPGNGSNGFVIPTSAQQDSFGAVIDLILNEQYSLADSLADYLHYSLYEWYDTGNNNHLYYVLMENGADNYGDVQLGWGTFIFDPAGFQEVIIEAPHPCWDTNTWKVAFKAYQNINAHYFLMAGTHRYANGSNPGPADVAHNTKNMFHTVHQKISPNSTHSLQVHGFSINNHLGYPDVILSNGSSNPTPILDSLSNAITPYGYSVGIFDGINWSQLGATTNKQGQWSRGQGYSFIHMELIYYIRASQSEWENIIEALHLVFLTPLGLESSTAYLPQNYQLKQNYPNPFNLSTTIEYYLNSAQNIQLFIYDLKGRLIKELVNSKNSAGMHKVIWNGKNMYNSNVSSGVYFYELKTNDIRIQKKLLLIK